MKVFLSWSGTTSHSLAIILRDWLPDVIQCLTPWVSSEDIDKGTRWATDIASELDASSYGIICLTEENVNAPWINFEAGALGKRFDSSHVSPILFNLRKSELKGPLVQFQLTVFEKDDMRKLMHSLNEAAGEKGIEPARLDKVFERWWPELETKLSALPVHNKEAVQPQDNPIERFGSILEELLDLTRSNHKILRDPATNNAGDLFAKLEILTERAATDSNMIDEMAVSLANLRMFIEAHRSVLEENDHFSTIDYSVASLEALCAFRRSHHRPRPTSIDPGLHSRLVKVKK